jgi:hypothetical protein
MVASSLTTSDRTEEGEDNVEADPVEDRRGRSGRSGELETGLLVESRRMERRSFANRVGADHFGIEPGCTLGSGGETILGSGMKEVGVTRSGNCRISSWRAARLALPIQP